MTRLNGLKLPRTQEEWELMHPGKDYKSLRDLILPGMRDEWNIARGFAPDDMDSGGEVVGVTGDGTNDAPGTMRRARRVWRARAPVAGCVTDSARRAACTVRMASHPPPPKPTTATITTPAPPPPPAAAATG